MSQLTNSINAPTPFAVNKGGTGNSAALTNGQLWIGNTGNTPSIGTITAGTNISVTNGAGTITVANTAAAGVVWQDIGSSTSVNLVANNGYITASSNPLFTLPALPAVGDTYLISGRLSGTGYRVNLQIFDIIEYNGVPGSLLTTTAPNAAITIVCTTGGTPAVFCVLSTNGSTFTLT